MLARCGGARLRPSAQQNCKATSGTTPGPTTSCNALLLPICALALGPGVDMDR